jgi:hypothetical protein
VTRRPTNEHGLFMAKYGTIDHAKQIARDHEDPRIRLMALARLYKEVPDDPEYRQLLAAHQAKDPTQ